MNPGADNPPIDPDPELVPIEDPRCAWNMIRPQGWASWLETLDVEPQPDGWYRVLWEVVPCNGGGEPPGPFTMFRKGDLVQLAWA